jgi:hypothetical protein
MAPACRGGNVSACAKFPEHAHFFHTVVLLIVIVGNSIRLASEVESDRARQRRAKYLLPQTVLNTGGQRVATRPVSYDPPRGWTPPS